MYRERVYTVNGQYWGIIWYKRLAIGLQVSHNWIRPRITSTYSDILMSMKKTVVIQNLPYLQFMYLNYAILVIWFWDFVLHLFRKNMPNCIPNRPPLVFFTFYAVKYAVKKNIKHIFRILYFVWFHLWMSEYTVGKLFMGKFFKYWNDSEITIFSVSGLGSFKLLKSMQPVLYMYTVQYRTVLAVPSHLPCSFSLFLLGFLSIGKGIPGVSLTLLLAQDSLHI